MADFQKEAFFAFFGSMERKYKGRQPIAADEETFKQEWGLWRSGQVTTTEAMKRLNLKQNTFHCRIKKMEL